MKHDSLVCPRHLECSSLHSEDGSLVQACVISGRERTWNPSLRPPYSVLRAESLWLVTRELFDALESRHFCLSCRSVVTVDDSVGGYTCKAAVTATAFPGNRLLVHANIETWQRKEKRRAAATCAPSTLPTISARLVTRVG